jgi:hypothetical protein
MRLRLCRQEHLGLLVSAETDLYRAECNYQEGWRPLVSINALHQVGHAELARQPAATAPVRG